MQEYQIKSIDPAELSADELKFMMDMQVNLTGDFLSRFVYSIVSSLMEKILPNPNVD